MKFTKSVLFSAVLLAISVNSLAQQKSKEVKIRSAEKQITNKNGEIRYQVSLNPFYIESIEKKAIAEGYVQADILRVSQDDPAIEKPAVRLAAKDIAALIGRKPVKVRSWAATEFEIDSTPEEVSKLFGVDGVIDISEAEGKETNFVLSQSATIAPGDTYSGSEIIPWWKSYTNTNDLNSYTYSPNIPYIIDGPLVSPISGDLNIVDNSSYEASSWSWDPSFWPYWHAAHVDGVIGAKSNNQLIRGINPDQPIRHYGSALSYTSVLDILNFIFAHSELTYTWSAINMSFNNGSDTPPALNSFEFSQNIGRSIAIASNRNIILQAAGNNNSAGCGFGYAFNSTAPAWDGIMLIGGHDSSGQRATDDPVYFNNGYGWGTVPGSNYGSCVELWAPSKQITSIRYNTTTTQVLSGTSFSAPITTAIAMRYGNTATRPLEREWFLRTNSQFTGSYADSAPIYSAKWTNAPSKLTRHVISSVWSPQTTANITNLYNGTYSDMWNSGGNVGTIVIDLGSAKNVKFIRLTPRSSVNLTDVYPVYFSVAASSTSTGSPSSTYQNYDVPKHGDRAPITIPLSDIYTRYIIVNGHNYGSWLAYSEVEVYGQ